jgi:hypothetical protein
MENGNSGTEVRVSNWTLATQTPRQGGPVDQSRKPH